MEVDDLSSSRSSNFNLQNFPTEVIVQIVKYLNVRDVHSLASVSKIWRCVYLNQNTIWKNICKQLKINEEDYLKYISTNGNELRSSSNYYIAQQSEDIFGPFCKWRKIYNHYSIISNIIKNGDFSISRIHSTNGLETYCNGNYLMIFKRNQTIDVYFLKGSVPSFPKVNIKLNDLFMHIFLLVKQHNIIHGNIMCEYVHILANDKFFVVEFCSVLFVYTNENGNFIFKYSKVIHRSLTVNQNNELKSDILPNDDFLMCHTDAEIRMSNDKLVIVYTHGHYVFLFDLNSAKILRKIEYCHDTGTLNCLKFSEDVLMIVFWFVGEDEAMLYEYHARLYDLKMDVNNDIFIDIPLYAMAIEFKENKYYIGIENDDDKTPIIDKCSKLVHWISCDTFSFGSTENCIYFTLGHNVFHYDLKCKQKLASFTMSDCNYLTSINDRFLLAKLSLPDAYDIFDIKNCHIVSTIKLPREYKLLYVCKLFMIIATKEIYKIIGFSS